MAEFKLSARGRVAAFVFLLCLLRCFPCAFRAGLTVDQEKAYELHLHSAKLGMPRAQYNTAVHYFEGKGVEQVKCVYW